MNKLIKPLAVIFCFSALSFNSFSQEIPVDTTAETQTVCLSECRHFISTNVLQFATGTANLNYEFHIVPQMSVKLGVGTVLGTRILFNESQQPCVPGGIYGMVEPRFYFKKASESCFVQYGLSASYKYWNFTAKNKLENVEDGVEYEKDNDYVVDGGTIYKKERVVEHLGGVSFFGKGCIAGGLTAELELGVGFGTKADKFYFSPNIGFSFGWTFGKKKSAE